MNREKAEAFIRLLRTIESLPRPVPNEMPLRDYIPGVWPTVGDLRALCGEIEDRGRWFGDQYCAFVGQAPVIDGCYFCGKRIPSDPHNHTQTEKKGFKGAQEDRYSCVCDNC